MRLDSPDRTIDLSALAAGDYRLIVADATSSGTRDCGGYQFTDGHQRYLVERERFIDRILPGGYDGSFSGVADGDYPSLALSHDGFSYRLSGTGQPSAGLRIEFTGDPVTAVGAILFALHPGGDRFRSAVRVVLDDGSQHRFMLLPQLPFRGFVTESPIGSMAIETESVSYRPGVDRLTVGRHR